MEAILEQGYPLHVGDEVTLTKSGIEEFSKNNWGSYSVPLAMFRGEAGVITEIRPQSKSQYTQYYVTNSKGTVYFHHNQIKLKTPKIGVDSFNPSLETRKNGKNKMELVETGFPNAFLALGEVMTWAAKNKGYLPNDWKDIPNPQMSLLGAASRHRNKRLKGEEFDDESSLPHLAHEAFNVMAQLELLIMGKL